MCRRNSRPRPLPWLAPGISPGTSAMVKTSDAGGDHAQVRLQRGERVVGDLRPGRGQHGHQRGLAGAGEADQADVGDRLQLQHDVGGIARLAEQREPGGLARAGGQRGVAQAAAAAAGGDVASHPVRPDRPARTPSSDSTTVPGRHPQFQALAVGAVLVVTLPGPAVAGLGVRPEVEVQQRVHVVVDDQRHVAAVAAVTAVRAAQRLELLPMDRGAPVAAVAGLQVQDSAVDEPGHGHLLGCGSISVGPDSDGH